MTSTLIPTCSFCGLRFENRPLLELHLREDHPGRGPAGAPASQPHPQSPAGEDRRRPADSRTKAGTITGPRRPRRPLTGWAMTGLRRITGAFRHANAELLLASELTFHPAGRPRPPQPADPPVEADAHQAGTSGRTDRAA